MLIYIDEQMRIYMCVCVCVCIFVYIFAYIYALQPVGSVVKAWIRARFLSVYLFI